MRTIRAWLKSPFPVAELRTQIPTAKLEHTLRLLTSAATVFRKALTLRTVVSISLGASLLCLTKAEADEGSTPPETTGGVVTVELQGRVVCLPELMHGRFATELAAEHQHVYGFETKDGAIYTLLRTKFSDALFVDERLRSKELLLRGRIFPKSQIFEVLRTRSVRDGAVYDVFYFCVVCNIESVTAGECACCREEVELRERIIKRER